MAKSAISATNQLKDLSEQFGITTDEVQQLKKIGSEVGGLGFEGIGQGLIKLGQAREKASTSDDKLLATFNKYGITLAQLQNPQLRNIDLMKQMAKAMDNLSASDRADFTELFGKQGQKIIETIRAINAAGPIDVISEDAINRLDDATERLQEIKRLLYKGIVTGMDPAIEALLGLKSDNNSQEDPVKKYSALPLNTPKQSSGGLKGLLKFLSPMTPINFFKNFLNDDSNADEGVPTFDALPKPKKKTGITELSPATREKLNQEMLAEEQKVTEAALKFRLSSVRSEYEKRELLEKQLAEKLASYESNMRRSGMFMDESDPAAMELRARALRDLQDASGLGGQLNGMNKAGKIDVSSLTSQGQLSTGRNVIVTDIASPIVKKLEDAIKAQEATKTAVDNVANVLKANPAIRIGR